MHTDSQPSLFPKNVPWNKGRLTGQKRPLKPKDVWAIRVRLQLQHRARDLALFNLAIDRKLRGCNLVRLQIDDVYVGRRVRDRATIIQTHLSTRQYARIVHGWIESTGLDSSSYGTHSMRRTKAAQVYKKTGNLRAVQLLLGHTKLESTVRYLGIEVDDALSISEQVEL